MIDDDITPKPGAVCLAPLGSAATFAERLRPCQDRAPARDQHRIRADRDHRVAK